MIIICYSISKTLSPGLVEPCTPFSIVRFSENNRHKSWAFRAPYKLVFVFTSLLFLVIKRGNGPGSITPFVSSRVMFFCNDNPCRFSPFNSLGNAVWHETLDITVNKKIMVGGKNKNIGATRTMCLSGSTILISKISHLSPNPNIMCLYSRAISLLCLSLVFYAYISVYIA